MAVLSYTTGLKLWLKFDELNYHNGAVAALTVRNSVNPTADILTMGGSAAQFHRPSNARPYVSFDGASNVLPSTFGMGTYLTAAAGTMFVVFRPTAIDGVSANATNNDGLITGTATTGPHLTLKSLGSGLYSIWAGNHDATTGYVSTSKPVLLNTWGIGIWYHSSATVGVGLNDAIGLTTVGTSGNSDGLATFLRLGESGGSNFFTGDIAEVLVYNAALTPENRATVANYLAAKWLDRGDAIEIARDVGSRRLLAQGRNRVAATLKGIPVARLITPGGTMGTDFGVSHPRGVNVDGNGWGRDSWSARMMRLGVQSLDLDNLTFDAAFSDLTDYRRAYMDSGVVTRADGNRREGQMILGAGPLRTFNRDSVAWITNPADGRTIIQIPTDAERVTSSGLSLQDGVASYKLLRSSFISGTTGLTATGTGTGGSAIAADTADLLFDSSITTNSLKFTKGSPHSVDLYETWPVTVGAAYNNVVYVSIDYKADGGEAPQWALERSSGTGVNWNAGSQTWTGVAGTPVWNTMASHPTVGPWRDTFKVNVGSSNVELKLRVGHPSGGTAALTSHVYHVQIDQNFVRDRIVTDAAAVAMATDQLIVRDASGLAFGQGSGPFNAGTICFKFTPAWDGADFSLGVFGSFFIKLLSMANGYAGSDRHSWEIAFSGVNQELEFIADPTTSYGGPFVASFPLVPVRGTTYRIVARRTTSVGELGLTPYTMSLFVNGVKGTDVVETAHPPDSLQMMIGAPATFSNDFVTPCGVISNLELKTEVMGDAKAAAWGL